MTSTAEALCDGTGRAGARIRVASVPSGHVYVRHLSDPDGGDQVMRLADIPPADGKRVPGGWWPPAMLDADWIAANHGCFDVFHVHFGFDAKAPEELEAVADALNAADVPLVVTVHDLRNPHHDRPELHEAQLDVLLRSAAAVITLTGGAAAQIASRRGVEAIVLGHPHVVDWSTMARPRPTHEGFVVGVHAKSLRANMDVLAVSEAAAHAVAQLPGARLQINVHREVFESGGHFYAPRTGSRLRRLAATHGAVELREHDQFSDAQLWEYLIGLDVSVLPYRFGTHSGWLEACFDLGTSVVAPSCGFYAEQQRVWTYSHDESRLDAASLADAIHHAYHERPAPRADPRLRRDERSALAAAHREIYAGVLG